MENTIQDVVDDLALRLGPEAPYFRGDRGRLYLSGVEIALAIAVGLTASYLSGLYKGAKKRLGEHGEKDGELLIDVALSRLRGISRKIVRARTDPDATRLLTEAHRELVEADDLKEARRLAKPKQDDAPVLDEVKTFLADVGYPSDLVEERAPVLVAELGSEIMGD